MKRIFKWQPKYERIYCFPNRFGFLGFALFLVMLAAGATYQNNLVFMMAFLFLSLGLIAILQTARNLRELEIISVEAEPTFASDQTTLNIKVKNPTQDLKLENDIRLKILDKSYTSTLSELPAQSYRDSKMQIQAPSRRGVYSLRRMGLYTSFPYALFTAWKFSKKNAELYVYPTPKNFNLPLASEFKNEDGFSGHKKFETGDSLARIDWKLLAKKNELHTRLFQDGAQKKVTIRWSDTENLSFEDRLSQMSFWLTQAELENAIYRTELPGYVSPEGHGPQHYRHTMQALTRLSV